MLRFCIVDSLPYLLAGGAMYRCRFDSEGFTVGDAVTHSVVPAETFSELAIKAQCTCLDSIGAVGDPSAPAVEAKKAGRRKKAVTE